MPSQSSMVHKFMCIRSVENKFHTLTSFNLNPSKLKVNSNVLPYRFKCFHEVFDEANKVQKLWSQVQGQTQWDHTRKWKVMLVAGKPVTIDDCKIYELEPNIICYHSASMCYGRICGMCFYTPYILDLGKYFSYQTDNV